MATTHSPDAIDIDTRKDQPLYAQVADALRARIVAGEYAPDARLPSESELCQSYKVSQITIRRALLDLENDGQVYRRQGRGTFVQAATSKMAVGLLFGPALVDEPAHFYRAMLKAFQAELRERDYACRVYDGLAGTTSMPLPPEAEIYQTLMSDLRKCRFAGLIEFGLRSFSLDGWQRQAALPHVRFDSRENSDVVYDEARFCRESVKFLVRHGRRRLVYLEASRSDYSSSGKELRKNVFMTAARDSGVIQPRIVTAMVPAGAQSSMIEKTVFQTMVETIRGWSRLPAAERPDGLMVDDDIVTRAAALALIQAGIRIPADLSVITLASKGVNLHYGIPVARYEFLPRVLAREIVALLRKRINNEPLPPLPIMVSGKIVEESPAAAG